MKWCFFCFKSSPCFVSIHGNFEFMTFSLHSFIKFRTCFTHFLLLLFQLAVASSSYFELCLIIISYAMFLSSKMIWLYLVIQRFFRKGSWVTSFFSLFRLLQISNTWTSNNAMWFPDANEVLHRGYCFVGDQREFPLGLVVLKVILIYLAII